MAIIKDVSKTTLTQVAKGSKENAVYGTLLVMVVLKDNGSTIIENSLIPEVDLKINR
jgi:hypothetical protein